MVAGCHRRLCAGSIIPPSRRIPVSNTLTAAHVCCNLWANLGRHQIFSNDSVAGLTNLVSFSCSGKTYFSQWWKYFSSSGWNISLQPPLNIFCSARIPWGQMGQNRSHKYGNIWPFRKAGHLMYDIVDSKCNIGIKYSQVPRPSMWVGKPD